MKSLALVLSPARHLYETRVDPSGWSSLLKSFAFIFQLLNSIVEQAKSGHLVTEVASILTSSEQAFLSIGTMLQWRCLQPSNSDPEAECSVLSLKLSQSIDVLLKALSQDATVCKKVLSRQPDRPFISVLIDDRAMHAVESKPRRLRH